MRIWINLFETSGSVPLAEKPFDFLRGLRRSPKQTPQQAAPAPAPAAQQAPAPAPAVAPTAPQPPAPASAPAPAPTQAAASTSVDPKDSKLFTDCTSYLHTHETMKDRMDFRRTFEALGALARKYPGTPFGKQVLDFLASKMATWLMPPDVSNLVKHTPGRQEQQNTKQALHHLADLIRSGSYADGIETQAQLILQRFAVSPEAKRVVTAIVNDPDEARSQFDALAALLR